MISRILLAVAGFVVGAAAVLAATALSSPEPLAAPPRAPGALELTLSISRDLFVREASRRIQPTLEKFSLREPQWELGQGGAILLNVMTTIPIVRTDVNVRIGAQIVERNGGLAVEIREIQVGRLGARGGFLNGLAESLNDDLSNVINPARYELTSVETYADRIELRLRVVRTL